MRIINFCFYSYQYYFQRLNQFLQSTIQNNITKALKTYIRFYYFHKARVGYFVFIKQNLFLLIIIKNRDNSRAIMLYFIENYLLLTGKEYTPIISMIFVSKVICMKQQSCVTSNFVEVLSDF